MKHLDLLMPSTHQRDVSAWATVTGLAPLRIRLDGEAAPLPFTPDTIAGGLAVSDRVHVAFTTNDDPAFRGRRVVVLGKAGGSVLAHTHSEFASIQASITNMEAAWTTWTPTLTNLTLGAGGVVTARRRLIGKTLDWKFKFKLGTGSAVGTSPKFTLSHTPHASYVDVEDELGRGTILNAGVENRDVVARVHSGSTILLVAYSTTGAHITIDANTPWTWTSGHSISVSGRTEIA